MGGAQREHLCAPPSPSIKHQETCHDGPREFQRPASDPHGEIIIAGNEIQDPVIEMDREFETGSSLANPDVLLVMVHTVIVEELRIDLRALPQGQAVANVCSV